MELNELLLPGEYEGDPIPAGMTVTGIENDGRTVSPGCLFICHEGTKYNSHLLLPTLREKGAVAAVVSREYTGKNPDILTVPVADTLRAEALICSRFFGSPGDHLTMIGVTGTNGKTSVATMIRHILNQAGFPCGMIGTTGFFGRAGDEEAFSRFRTGEASTMTTPPPLTLYPLLSAMRERGITHVVMEVSSQALDQGRVAPLTFACSVFTNLSPEHLDYHGTMTDYLNAKKILFRQTKTAIVNADSPWSDLLLDGLSCRRVACGTLPSGDVRASEVAFEGSAGVSFACTAGGDTFPVFVPLPGSFTVQNALLALAASIRLGADRATAVGALSRMPTVPGRMERVNTDGFPFTVLIDYAHTEAALRSLLLSVRAFCKKEERIVLLFGCGGDRDPSKRSEMGKTAAAFADFTIVTSDNSRTEDPKAIIRAILSGMSDRSKRRVIVNRERAITYAILSAQPGDVVLLVGKGHEKYEIGADGAREFDEKKIVERALEARRSGHTMEDRDADQYGQTD